MTEFLNAPLSPGSDINMNDVSLAASDSTSSGVNNTHNVNTGANAPMSEKARGKQRASGQGSGSAGK